MTTPQPFQYQGSKRALAAAILRHLPMHLGRFVEPFAGSAALSLACATENRATQYWLNDANKPLAELLGLIINQPQYVADRYRDIWCAKENDPIENFYRVREDFNRTQNPNLLLYLLARCVKGSVRYNSDGLFNQSPDKRRLGTAPSTMRHNIAAVSHLLLGKTIVTTHDYRDVLANCQTTDVVYMDPPYQGVCGERDTRYYSGISHNDFIAELEKLNSRNVPYLISYDGRLGTQSYGKTLPDSLNLTRIELTAGRSTQATLLGRNTITIESLYLSHSLLRMKERNPPKIIQYTNPQLQLFSATIN